MENKLEPSVWKKILNFIIELIKLIIAIFLGTNGASLLN